jgi:hypothetical protein
VRLLLLMLCAGALYAQDRPVSAPPFDPSSYSFDSVALNAMAAYVIRSMRGSAWFPWISHYTPRITKITSAVIAAATASLMTVKWEMDQTGAGTFTVSGITLASVLSFVWLLLKNYTFQGGGIAIMDIWQKVMIDRDTPIVVTGKPDKPAPASPSASTFIDET